MAITPPIPEKVTQTQITEQLAIATESPENQEEMHKVPIAKGSLVRQSGSTQLGFNWHGEVIDLVNDQAKVVWKEFLTEEELIYPVDNLTCW